MTSIENTLSTTQSPQRDSFDTSQVENTPVKHNKCKLYPGGLLPEFKMLIEGVPAVSEKNKTHREHKSLQKVTCSLLDKFSQSPSRLVLSTIQAYGPSTQAVNMRSNNTFSDRKENKAVTNTKRQRKSSPPRQYKRTKFGKINSGVSHGIRRPVKKTKPLDTTSRQELARRFLKKDKKSSKNSSLSGSVGDLSNLESSWSLDEPDSTHLSEEVTHIVENLESDNEEHIDEQVPEDVSTTDELLARITKLMQTFQDADDTSIIEIEPQLDSEKVNEVDKLLDMLLGDNFAGNSDTNNVQVSFDPGTKCDTLDTTKADKEENDKRLEELMLKLENSNYKDPDDTDPFADYESSSILEYSSNSNKTDLSCSETSQEKDCVQRDCHEKYLITENEEVCDVKAFSDVLCCNGHLNTVKDVELHCTEIVTNHSDHCRSSEHYSCIKSRNFDVLLQTAKEPDERNDNANHGNYSDKECEALNPAMEEETKKLELLEIHKLSNSKYINCDDTNSYTSYISHINSSAGTNTSLRYNEISQKQEISEEQEEKLVTKKVNNCETKIFCDDSSSLQSELIGDSNVVSVLSTEKIVEDLLETNSGATGIYNSTMSENVDLTNNILSESSVVLHTNCISDVSLCTSVKNNADPQTDTVVCNSTSPRIKEAIYMCNTPEKEITNKESSYADRSPDGSGIYYSAESSPVTNTDDKICKFTTPKLFSIFIKGSPSSSKSPSPQNNLGMRRSKLPSKEVEGQEQLLLDAGQKKFGMETCITCSFVYDPDCRTDVELHIAYHNRHGIQLKHVGWKNERVIVDYKEHGYIIMVQKNDPITWWRRVTTILETVNNDLGFIEDIVDFKNIRYKVFLYIYNKNVASCIVAEDISEANKLLPGDEILCTEETFPATCGIVRIWTSHKHRRKSYATKLMDALRENFLSYRDLELSEIAFSSPSQSGRAFAARYLGTPTFLVYN